MKTNETHQSNTTLRRTVGSVCLASCRKLLAQIGSAKAGIQAEFRQRLAEHEHLLELAINEAEALAWQTGFPQLVFPTLAMEKVQAAAAWHERQQYLNQHRSPVADIA